MKLKEWYEKLYDKVFSIGFFKAFLKIPGLEKLLQYEMISYLFFGVMTTAVSFVTAGISKHLLESAGLGKAPVSTISTAISWICAVTFAYVTNRIWVFDSNAKGKKGIFAEMVSFYGGRLFTLFVEMGIMWLGYDLMDINYWVTKIFANVVVLILNYVISKLFVFKKKADQ